MHRITLTTIVLLLATTCLTAQKYNKSLYRKASAYFRNPTSEIPNSRVKKFHEDSLAIWAAWKDYILESDENSLAQLSPLSSATAHHWMIPDSLEPSATLNYYYGTKGDSSVPRLPLYIYLHGSGPRQLEWATGLRICSAFDDAPSAYFIPQIPQEGSWYRWYQKSKQWFIERMLRQALASERIDPYRLYLFGISEGGYGSQRLASFYADYLAAAGPMAGGEPLKNAPAENCGNIGFSLLTGEKDYAFYRNTLTGYTLAAFDSLQKLYPRAFPHRIELIPDKGHHIDYTLTTPWLKTFKRNPNPTSFIWEDYEMDNRHRQGFYNILVHKRPSPDLRTRYEMTITGDTINLTIQDITYTCTQKDTRWGIEMKFSRSYTPSHGGQITLFLHPSMVDLTHDITIILNNQTLYHSRPRPTTRALLRSLTTFADPLRIFPVAIELTY